MQRMFNIDKWQCLTATERLRFVNEKPRNVRVEVNAPYKSQLHMVDHNGEVHFLALVEGRDTIEFGTSGAFELGVAEGEIMVYTADGSDISMVVEGAESFTKIVQRRARNPELEEMMFLMGQNMERRLEQQAYELEQSFVRRQEALASQPPAAGVSDGAGSESAPTPVAGASDTPPAGADGGGSDDASGS